MDQLAVRKIPHGQEDLPLAGMSQRHLHHVPDAEHRSGKPLEQQAPLFHRGRLPAVEGLKDEKTPLRSRLLCEADGAVAVAVPVSRACSSADRRVGSDPTSKPSA